MPRGRLCRPLVSAAFSGSPLSMRNNSLCRRCTHLSPQYSMAESESPSTMLLEMSQMLSDKAKVLEKGKKRKGKKKALFVNTTSSSSEEEPEGTNVTFLSCKSRAIEAHSLFLKL